jgi:hypothetical protein
MKAPYYVEVLSPGREVLQRHQVEVLPISLGRGYDNDVILEDPHISAHHAAIEETGDGGLLIRDLGSRNGVVHNGSRLSEMRIDGDTVLRLGKVSIRVRYADFQVTDEVAESASADWEGWRPAAAGLAMVIGITGVGTWLGETQTFDATRYLLPIVVTLLLVMLWCGAWAFANRVFGGHARLGRHLFIFGCGLAVLKCWDVLRTWLGYGFSLETVTRYGSHVSISIFAAIIFYHLLNIKPYRRRAFVAVCAGLALLGSTLKLIGNYHSNGRLADELFMHERLPKVLRLSRDKTVSRLMGDAAGLKAAVDRERSKAVTGDDAVDDEDPGY